MCPNRKVIRNRLFPTSCVVGGGPAGLVSGPHRRRLDPAGRTFLQEGQHPFARFVGDEQPGRLLGQAFGVAVEPFEHGGRGYEYLDLDPETGHDPTGSPQGAGTLGFAGTTHKASPGQVAGLITLPNDAFGGSPRTPMMPGTWDTDSATRVE